jgi:hypothetical protein
MDARTGQPPGRQNSASLRKRHMSPPRTNYSRGFAKTGPRIRRLRRHLCVVLHLRESSVGRKLDVCFTHPRGSSYPRNLRSLVVRRTLSMCQACPANVAGTKSLNASVAWSAADSPNGVNCGASSPLGGARGRQLFSRHDAALVWTVGGFTCAASRRCSAYYLRNLDEDCRDMEAKSKVDKDHISQFSNAIAAIELELRICGCTSPCHHPATRTSASTRFFLIARFVKQKRDLRDGRGGILSSLHQATSAAPSHQRKRPMPRRWIDKGTARDPGIGLEVRKRILGGSRRTPSEQMPLSSRLKQKTRSDSK